MEGHLVRSVELGETWFQSYQLYSIRITIGVPMSARIAEFLSGKACTNLTCRYLAISQRIVLSSTVSHRAAKRQ
jgi:hypothetical protein